VPIEDMPIRFFCVSSNLTSIELSVHERGLLWAAVRASGSMPGAAPPMFHDGQVLVDGAVLNNLPGDIMQERFGGRLVAVDVSALDGLQVPAGVPETPSGWMILLRRLLGRPWPVPGVTELLYCCSGLRSAGSAWCS
jgi:predicted acylesterase/phospholipase RssA